MNQTIIPVLNPHIYIPFLLVLCSSKSFQLDTFIYMGIPINNRSVKKAKRRTASPSNHPHLDSIEGIEMGVALFRYYFFNPITRSLL